jgi:hypothetical protein
MYRRSTSKRKDRDGIEGTVVGIEYDPNRTCHIALIEYADGVKRYVLSAGRAEGRGEDPEFERRADRAAAGQLRCRFGSSRRV